ncbi:MAG: tetratricopeptide repeat protein, partial [Lentisphaeria bacterium]|nr:tetratricopeptide repeat protein [Lentisphaeria bacterium]
ETEDCIATFEAALRIRADQPDIHRHLGAALMKLNRIDDAIGHFQEAVRLAPDDPAAHRYLEAAREMRRNQDGGK